MSVSHINNEIDRLINIYQLNTEQQKSVVNEQIRKLDERKRTGRTQS